ncbi:hypothetical protein IAG15_27225, partial [Enterococcus faecalis]|nr:hypothetical protein [Enterococcus faecalis]
MPKNQPLSLFSSFAKRLSARIKMSIDEAVRLIDHRTYRLRTRKDTCSWWAFSVIVSCYTDESSRL